MKEIIILDLPPLIFTKDKDFKPKPIQVPGQIIYLPEDAVLVIQPVNVEKRIE